jgi:hypothetical protein
MTLAQGLAFAIVTVMMALFAWGRWRYDLVAVVALLAAVVVGVVPPDQAFKGFSDDIVIIVGSALVVSAAVARSGVIERIARLLGPYLVTINRQIIALVGSVMVLSAFVKNVGARYVHADSSPACATKRNFPLLSSDADVIWGTARGYRDAGRHLAKYHCFAGPRAVGRHALRHVRFYTSWQRYCLSRLPLSCLRLAVTSSRSQGRSLYGRRL